MPKDVTATLKRFTSNFRVGGRTAYIAAERGSRSAAGEERWGQYAGCRAHLQGQQRMCCCAHLQTKGATASMHCNAGWQMLCMPVTPTDPTPRPQAPTCNDPLPPCPAPSVPAGLGDQSFALMLYVRTNGSAPTTNPLVQKLAVYVASGPSTSYGPCTVSVSGFDGALQASHRACSSPLHTAGCSSPCVHARCLAAMDPCACGAHGTPPHLPPPPVALRRISADTPHPLPRAFSCFSLRRALPWLHMMMPLTARTLSSRSRRAPATARCCRLG